LANCKQRASIAEVLENMLGKYSIPIIGRAFPPPRGINSPIWTSVAPDYPAECIKVSIDPIFISDRSATEIEEPGLIARCRLRPCQKAACEPSVNFPQRALPIRRGPVCHSQPVADADHSIVAHSLRPVS